MMMASVCGAVVCPAWIFRTRQHYVQAFERVNLGVSRLGAPEPPVVEGTIEGSGRIAEPRRLVRWGPDLYLC